MARSSQGAPEITYHALLQAANAEFSSLRNTQIAGRTSYDQDWIDGNVEAGVGGCGWKRPAARPPGLDARNADKRAVHKAPKKKPGFLARVKRALWGSRSSRSKKKKKKKHPLAVEPTPAPAPRDPVYELLGVEGENE